MSNRADYFREYKKRPEVRARYRAHSLRYYHRDKEKKKEHWNSLARASDAKLRKDPAYVEKCREATRRCYAKARMAVLVIYGNKCECCGEDRYEFLAIDHRFGGGRKERKRESKLNFLRRLANTGKPLPEYRILCHNCNLALGFYGSCPHQKSTLEIVSGIAC